MKSITAVLILGGGVAVLAAVAANSSKPAGLPSQEEINASILRTLAEIEAKKKAEGKS